MQDKQKNECSELLLDLLKQNNLLIQQNNQLIQINNEQNVQINELLIQLEGGDDEPKKSQYLDG